MGGSEVLGMGQGRMTPPDTPEQQARIEIDRQLEAAGWQVQDLQAALEQFGQISADLEPANNSG